MDMSSSNDKNRHIFTHDVCWNSDIIIKNWSL